MIKKHTRCGYILSLCVAAWATSGCHASRLNLFPEFIDLKKNTSTVTLMADMMIVDAIRDDTNKMNVIENKELGDLLLGLCADSLQNKGFTVERSMVTSIGLLMNRNIPYRVVQTVADQATHDEDLPIGAAPFYVHEAVEQDTLFRQHLASVYTALLNSPQKQEGVSTIIPDAIHVGEKFTSGMLMIILLGGTNVSVTKTLGEYAPSPSITQGFVGVQHDTRLSILIYIINPKTGEVVWDDRVYKNGGLIFQDRVFSVVNDMLKDLP